MDLFKGICLFLKIFVVTLLRITKKEGHRASRAPKNFYYEIGFYSKITGQRYAKYYFACRIYNSIGKLYFFYE